MIRLWLIVFLLWPALIEAQVSVAVGSKAKPTSAAPVTDVTSSLGFAPKIVFFGMSENSLLTANSSGTVVGIGVGISSSEEFFTGWNAQDNVATTITDRRYSNTRVVYSTDASGSTAANAVLASLDADGFTLTWDPNDSNATLYNYMAIGGASITANITEQTLSTSSGNVTYAHGLGTTPSVIFILSAHHSSSATTNTALHSFGVATVNGDQWVLANAAANGTAVAADMNAESYARTTMVMARISAGAVVAESSFVSADATNVTLNQSSGWTANLFTLVAIAGGSWQAGSTAKTTGAEPAADTIASGLGFEPKGLFLVSHSQAASTSVLTNAEFSLGFASEANEASYAASYDDAVFNTMADSRLNGTRALVMINPTSGAVVIDAELDVSLDANGITGSWVENHATASQILWLAFGEGPPAGGIIPRLITQFRQRR